MPEIPGPGTPILVLAVGLPNENKYILCNGAIKQRLNGGTVLIETPDLLGEWEAEAIIVYRLIRCLMTSSQPAKAEPETESQPSLGEEHVESIEPASDKPSVSAEGESKHQEDSPLKRKRRSAREL